MPLRNWQLTLHQFRCIPPWCVSALSDLWQGRSSWSRFCCYHAKSADHHHKSIQLQLQENERDFKETSRVNQHIALFIEVTKYCWYEEEQKTTALVEHRFGERGNMWTVSLPSDSFSCHFSIWLYLISLFFFLWTIFGDLERYRMISPELFL